MSVGMPAIQRVGLQQVNSSTRRFVGVIRSVRNDSILLNTIHRLAFDFQERTWWVEEQKVQRLLSDTPVRPKKKKNAEQETDSNFALAQKYNREPVPLPGGVAVPGILKENEGLLKEGIAYIHFFPNGYNEHSIIYLAKEGAAEVAYSLIVPPTSGKIEIVREQIKEF